MKNKPRKPVDFRVVCQHEKFEHIRCPRHMDNLGCSDRLSTLECKNRITHIAIDSDDRWWGYRGRPNRNNELIWGVPKSGVCVPVEINWKKSLIKLD